MLKRGSFPVLVEDVVMMGRYGHMGLLRRARAADGGAVLLLDAGDMWQGTLASNLTEGASMVAAYNVLGVDAATIGNHEFDFGLETFNERQRQAGFPRRGDVDAQGLLLDVLAFGGVVIIKPGFADADAFGVSGDARELFYRGHGFVACRHRVCAGTLPPWKHPNDRPDGRQEVVGSGQSPGG